MTNDEKAMIPVWALATSDVRVPDVALGGPMNAERLAELRTVLTVMADSPITTLEVHEVPVDLDRASGIRLGAASPLAVQLGQLVGQGTKVAGSKGTASATDETLYRMVVPAKVAGQVATNTLKPMASKAVPGGIRGALVGSKGIAAQASFVPAGGTGVAAAGAGAAAVTVAAPLVLMAVAVGVSAYADHQRQEAIERIEALVKRLHQERLDDERHELDSCRDVIEKATGLLLDRGKIGATIGISQADFAMGAAVAKTTSRLRKWEAALTGFGDKPVDLGKLRESFDGIGSDRGEFQTHLELAALTIASKRRLIVLQAVEHAQMDDGNAFDNFLRALDSDRRKVDELESRIAAVLRKLSTLQLTRRAGLRDLMLTSGEVDDLLRSSHKLHALAERIEPSQQQPDVEIDIIQSHDGMVVVLPARPVA